MQSIKDLCGVGISSFLLKNIKAFILSFIVLTLSACGSGSNNPVQTPQELAIEKIANYAQNSAVEPTLQDYLDAGITGVEASNLADINTAVEQLTYDDVDTEAEIQALADSLGVVLLDAPILENGLTQIYNENEEIALLSFNNSGGGTLTNCNADTLPVGLVVATSTDSSTCEITGTPTAVQASTVHTITASNLTGIDTATVSIEVKAIVIPLALPSLENVTAQSYTTGVPIEPLSFTNDGGGELSTCTISPVLPIGLSIVVSTDTSTCEITGMPTVVQAATLHTITTTNATGSDTATVSIEVSALVTAIGEWQGIEIATIVNESNKTVKDPQLVMDEAGNGWLAWQQADGTNPNLYSIWVNSYNSENGWGTAEKIETLDYETEPPTIAMNASGNVIVVWGYKIPTLNSGFVWQLWGSQLGADKITWGTQSHIYGGTNTSERSPRAPKLAMDANGNALLLWNMASGLSNTGYQLRSSYFDAVTSTWEGVTEVGISPDFSDVPRLVMNADGQAMAIWRDNYTFLANGFGETRKVINGRYFNPGTGWGVTQQISFADTTTAIDGSITPQLAMDTSGNVTVVWSHNKILSVTKSEYNVWARHYSVVTGWDSSVLLETNDSKYGITPQVAMNDSGNAIVIWGHRPEEQSSALKSIWVNPYSPTGGWAGAQQIETSDVWQNTTPLPQIGLDANGNAMAIWMHRENSINNIKATRFNQLTNIWEPIEAIGSETGAIHNPLLATTQMGRALAVWQADTGFGPYNLKSNLFK